MIKWLIQKRLDAAERELGQPVDYVRHILGVSLGAFLKFTNFLSVSNYRRVLPVELYHIARIVATRDEDCGTCVQIEVNLAKKDGLPLDQLRLVLDRKPEALPEDLADVYRFAEAVVTASGDEREFRERIRARHGERALVELSLAIASCRTFPIIKRALGYATRCALVEIKI
jgi:alkylhydroperoxidase family enzyme